MKAWFRKILDENNLVQAQLSAKATLKRAGTIYGFFRYRNRHLTYVHAIAQARSIYEARSVAADALERDAQTLLFANKHAKLVTTYLERARKYLALNPYEQVLMARTKETADYFINRALVKEAQKSTQAGSLQSGISEEEIRYVTELLAHSGLEHYELSKQELVAYLDTCSQNLDIRVSAQAGPSSPHATEKPDRNLDVQGLLRVRRAKNLEDAQLLAGHELGQPLVADAIEQWNTLVGRMLKIDQAHLVSVPVNTGSGDSLTTK